MSSPRRRSRSSSLARPVEPVASADDSLRMGDRRQGPGHPSTPASEPRETPSSEAPAAAGTWVARRALTLVTKRKQVGRVIHRRGRIPATLAPAHGLGSVASQERDLGEAPERR